MIREPQPHVVLGRIWSPLSTSEWVFYPQGALVISPQGQIRAVGEASTLLQRFPQAPVTDYGKAWLLPGLIDAHTHLPQWPIRGKTAGTLLEWLNQYAFPVEGYMKDVGYAQALAKAVFAELAAHGTTTAVVLSSRHTEATHAAFEAARDSGLRVIMGKVMMDQNVPDAMREPTEEAIQTAVELAKTWHGAAQGRLHYAFTPRFALSCSARLLEKTAEAAANFSGSYIHSHLAENPQEVAAVVEAFGGKRSYTQVYQQFGCLGPRTLMAHGIYLSLAELDVLAETQTRLVHCPTSNMFLKSGCFPLEQVKQANIPLALATDVGAGPDVSMFSVMRAMDEMQYLSHTWVSPAESLYAATLGGAKALGLDAKIGTLEVGKEADFIVVNADALNATSPTYPHVSVEEVLSQLVYLGRASVVQATYVRGWVVYDRGSVCSAALG